LDKLNSLNATCDEHDFAPFMREYILSYTWWRCFRSWDNLWIFLLWPNL